MLIKRKDEQGPFLECTNCGWMAEGFDLTESECPECGDPRYDAETRAEAEWEAQRDQEME
jgi:predicted RNA-binding Zn-ribbon protein involved in translation (DUF1610 family)